MMTVVTKDSLKDSRFQHNNFLYTLRKIPKKYKGPSLSMEEGFVQFWIVK